MNQPSGPLVHVPVGGGNAEHLRTEEVMSWISGDKSKWGRDGGRSASSGIIATVTEDGGLGRCQEPVTQWEVGAFSRR